ncbi:MAG: hypothetical protein Q8Q56_04285 [Alphaproteobacteria bacterium]|nr:hypothetical protein [Alphaproteobacteria bacterium]
MITFGEVIILTFGSVTAIQFINPIIRFRLKVFGNGWVWLGLLAGIALTIMGSYISNAFFSDAQKDFLNIVVGFLCIIVVFAPIMIVSKPIKYSRWNSKTYVQECKRIIISREPKDLISLINEIDISIDIIAKHYIKKIHTTDIEKLFSLLVEPHICKILVKQFPGLLSKFIQRLLKTKIGEVDIKLGAVPDNRLQTALNPLI